MTDQQLLQDYTQRRSNDAMCELINRHIGMVHAAATRELKDAHLADDATQAVFLVLLRRASSLSKDVCLGGWLFQVTRLVAAEARRERIRRQRREREAAAMQSQSVSPPPEPEYAELAPWLNEALAALSHADRDALVLRHLENKPIQEVALLLGTSENTARQRIFRALERLRKQFFRRRLLITETALGVALDQSSAHAAPAALAETLQSVIRTGAIPAHASQALAKGALHMMWKSHMMTVGGSAAAIVAVVAGMGIAMAATQGPRLAAPPAMTQDADPDTEPLTVQAVNQLFVDDPARPNPQTGSPVRLEFTGTNGAVFHGTIVLNTGKKTQFTDRLPKTLIVRGATSVTASKERNADVLGVTMFRAAGGNGRAWSSAGTISGVRFTDNGKWWSIGTARVTP